MDETAIAYADSIYALASEEDLGERIGEEITEIDRIMKEIPEYRRLLSEPSIPGEERRKMIDEAWAGQIHQYTLNFLKLLCDEGITGLIPQIRERFMSEYDRDHNISRAVVTGAVKLSESQLGELKRKLEEVSGRTVILTEKTDESLLAGLTVDMDGHRYDGSALSRLTALRKAVKG